MTVTIISITTYYDEENPHNGSKSIVKVFADYKAAQDYFASLDHTSSWREYDIEEWVVD